MAITFSLPEPLESELRRDVGDLNAAAKEALLVELYRHEKLTHSQLSSLLGLSRYETDGVLKRHGVYYDLTMDDVIADAGLSQQARTE